ncbi:MAG: hypothetical protein FJX76_01225 [Armatimonadetes bacterium]|nr:hypothetical protein [Armatimonadota bacterium]
MTDDDVPLLDSAQEVLRFLDGYFPHYLAAASAHLHPGRPVVVAGGGLGLLSLLLARDGGFTVYAWEPRPAWQALARTWAAENGVQERIVFLPAQDLESLHRDPDVQAAILEPPLISLLDVTAWWRETRSILEWSHGRVFLPAALNIRVAIGNGRRPRFLDEEHLRALVAHYQETLGVDLRTVLNEATAQLHPRLLNDPPPAAEVWSEWHSQPLDLAAWLAEPRRTIHFALDTPTDGTVDRMFLTLGLADTTGTPIESSLFEAHQRLELVFPSAVRWQRGNPLRVDLELGAFGFERYSIEWEKPVLLEERRGALSQTGKSVRGWPSAPLPGGLEHWPASAPRFHLADHLAMLDDRPRIAAYQRALQERVRSGQRVFDLGAGTGLLGLSALRAGAAHLTSIDRDGYVLEIARHVLKSSGVGDRVELRSGLSHTLAAEGERADLLVSEILGDKALNEGVLEYMVDARQRLCQPGATVIPHRLEVFIAACQSG